MIIRNRIYTCLVDEMNKLNKKPNYMTVVAAIKELEKIEMTRLAENIYRLDHAVMATQKKILKAFDLTDKNIEYQAHSISHTLQTIINKEGKKNGTT